jgi:septum formation protein
MLRNRSHILVSAVAVMRDDMCLWRFVDSAKLTMRFFSDDFLRRYIDDSGDAILSSVGAYRIEGTGIQLFSRIEGDYFTVQGMPLLPLLNCLRRYNALAR